MPPTTDITAFYLAAIYASADAGASYYWTTDDPTAPVYSATYATTTDQRTTDHAAADHRPTPDDRALDATSDNWAATYHDTPD